MPIYEYQCDRCPAKFGVLTSVERRNDRQTCPNCGAEENHPVDVSDAHNVQVRGPKPIQGAGAQE